MKAFRPVCRNLLTVPHSCGSKAQIFAGRASSGQINAEPGIVKGGTTTAAGGKSVYDNADDPAKCVKSVQAAANARHVDMMAHSRGGLVARLYIDESIRVLPDFTKPAAVGFFSRFFSRPRRSGKNQPG